MIINATTSLLFARRSGSGAMFRRFYKPIGLAGLLRPGSDMHQSRYAQLYRDFYDNHYIGQRLSTGEVIQALKVLTPMVEVPFRTLLAGHIETTYGTDFDCIEASSALRRCPRRNDGSPPGERHERHTS